MCVEEKLIILTLDKQTLDDRNAHFQPYVKIIKVNEDFVVISVPESKKSDYLVFEEEN